MSSMFFRTFFISEKISSSALYPTGSTRTEFRPSVSNFNNRSYSLGINPSIGQESISSKPQNDNRLPKARYAWLVAHRLTSLVSFLEKLSTRESLNGSNTSSWMPLIFLTCSKYRVIYSLSIFPSIQMTRTCEASPTCCWP